MSKSVTIVIPVYADWPSFKDCLEAVIETVDLNKHKVMIMNDSGPEADMIEANTKKLIKGQPGFEYYRNPKNLGFVGTCNRAVLELDKTKNDVLLLNSDTIPTAGWLEEMLDVLSISKKNATVTSRSNNATLATVPLWAAHQKGLSPEKSFATFQKLKKHLPRTYEIPTGHGFCMLIRRELINKYGLFDTAFGRGYGEENDLSQRLIQKGYKNLLANHAYVFHLEARSFTHSTKQELMAKNNQIIWQRYPNYRQDVRNYMERTIAAERELESAAGIKAPSKIKAVPKKILRRLKVIS